MNRIQPGRTLRLATVSIALVLMSANANAALIDQGATTVDTSTGLTWLDIDLTKGLTPLDILADTGGFFSDGWEVASGAEVDLLFENAGVPSPASDIHIYGSDTTLTDYMLALFDETSPTITGGAFGQAWAVNSPGVYSAPGYTSEPTTLSFSRGSSAVSSLRPIPTVGVWLNRSGSAPFFL